MCTVEVEVNGIQYRAISRIEHGMLIVSSPCLGSKCATFRPESREALSSILLRELVEDKERKWSL